MSKRICLVVGYGQSNEQGSAVTGAAASSKVVSMYGMPLEFPAGRSSAFHVLAALLGAEGHMVWLRNLAFGGTGMLGSWNGWCRTRIASSNGFAPGSWCLPTTPNGRKYLAGGTPGVSQTTAAGDPTGGWTTTIDATVVDGTVTWTCKAADAKDVNGYVYQQGDSGYDPRGYIAGVLAAIVDAKQRGFEVWSLMAGHQSDYGQPAATVAAPLINLIRRVLGVGADRVYLGVTNRYVGDVSAPQWDAGGFYPTVRDLALAAYADDPRVLRGADLSAITSAADCDPASPIHLNDRGTNTAGQLWRNAIVV